LKFNDRAVLPGAGKISHEKAEALAERKYDLFAVRRRAQIEDKAEADTLKQLEAEVKKLPKRKKPKKGKT